MATLVFSLALLAIGGNGAHSAAAGQGWQQLADDPFGAVYPAATVGPAGTIYVFDGAADGTYPGAPLQMYDPVRGTWSSNTKAAVPPHGFEALVASGNTIFAVGGANGCCPPNMGPIAHYSIPLGTWTDDPSSPCAQQGAGATLGHDGRIYVAGGYGAYGLDSCLEIYDPRTRTWDNEGETPDPVTNPGVATGPDGRIYVIGGVSGSGPTSAVVPDVQIFDPATQGWSLGTPIPTARTELAAVTGSDGRIYAIGGSPDAHGGINAPTPRSLGAVEVYDPRTGTWSKLPGLKVPRYGLAAVMGRMAISTRLVVAIVSW
jgi:N-acetylneuraminic acid mutarotase